MGQVKSIIKRTRVPDNRVYYSYAEIEKHTSEESLWVVAGEKVYDITSFAKMQSHSGGSFALFTRGGGGVDCLEDYKQHSKETRKKWNNYLIGYVKKNKY